jgi:hypothetical protein
MSAQQPQNVSYGLNQPLTIESPYPIASKRAPRNSDFAVVGTIWCDVATNTIYILASITSNTANWISIGGGGAGVFASLTVNPGPITLTGTTNINTTGTAVTLIGNTTGGVGISAPLSVSGGDITLNDLGAHSVEIGLAPGTGPVHIGNATGNTFIDDGNLNISDGNVVLGTNNAAYTFLNGVKIISGNGDPNGIMVFTSPIGSLYLNGTPTGTTDRLFVNTDGGTTWTYFPSNA